MRLIETDVELGEDASVAIQTGLAIVRRLKTVPFMGKIWAIVRNHEAGRARAGMSDLAALAERLATALSVILPMAKGYAAAHQVGANAEKIGIAEDTFAEYDAARSVRPPAATASPHAEAAPGQHAPTEQAKGGGNLCAFRDGCRHVIECLRQERCIGLDYAAGPPAAEAPGPTGGPEIAAIEMRAMSLAQLVAIHGMEARHNLDCIMLSEDVTDLVVSHRALGARLAEREAELAAAYEALRNVILALEEHFEPARFATSHVFTSVYRDGKTIIDPAFAAVAHAMTRVCEAAQCYANGGYFVDQSEELDMALAELAAARKKAGMQP